MNCLVAQAKALVPTIGPLLHQGFSSHLTWNAVKGWVGGFATTIATIYHHKTAEAADVPVLAA